MTIQAVSNTKVLLPPSQSVTIPPEILGHILSYLPNADLYVASQVSHDYKREALRIYTNRTLDEAHNLKVLAQLGEIEELANKPRAALINQLRKLIQKVIGSLHDMSVERRVLLQQELQDIAVSCIARERLSLKQASSLARDVGVLEWDDVDKMHLDIACSLGFAILKHVQDLRGGNPSEVLIMAINDGCTLLVEYLLKREDLSQSVIDRGLIIALEKQDQAMLDSFLNRPCISKIARTQAIRQALVKNNTSLVIRLLSHGPYDVNRVLETAVQFECLNVLDKIVEHATPSELSTALKLAAHNNRLKAYQALRSFGAALSKQEALQILQELIGVGTQEMVLELACDDHIGYLDRVDAASSALSSWRISLFAQLIYLPQMLACCVAAAGAIASAEALNQS